MKQQPLWQTIRVGGSDAPTIMGDNPYSNIYELWQIKTGMIDRPDLKDKESVQWGIILEEPVLKEVLRRLGLEYDKSKTQHMANNHTGDKVGYIDYLANPDHLIEIKTTSAYNRDWEDGVPLYNYWQVVHYFHIVPTAKKATVACLIGGQRLVMHTIERDESEIARLVEAEDAFLELCRTNTPPEMPQVEVIEGDVYDMDSDVEYYCERYIELNAERKEKGKELDALKALIQELVGIGNTQSGHSYQASFKQHEHNTFDRKALETDHPEIDYNKYNKTSVFTRATIKQIRR